MLRPSKNMMMPKKFSTCSMNNSSVNSPSSLSCVSRTLIRVSRRWSECSRSPRKRDMRSWVAFSGAIDDLSKSLTLVLMDRKPTGTSMTAFGTTTLLASWMPRYAIFICIYLLRLSPLFSGWRSVTGNERVVHLWWELSGIGLEDISWSCVFFNPCFRVVSGRDNARWTMIRWARENAATYWVWNVWAVSIWKSQCWSSRKSFGLVRGWYQPESLKQTWIQGCYFAVIMLTLGYIIDGYFRNCIGMRWCIKSQVLSLSLASSWAQFRRRDAETTWWRWNVYFYQFWLLSSSWLVLLVKSWQSIPRMFPLLMISKCSFPLPNL